MAMSLLLMLSSKYFNLYKNSYLNLKHPVYLYKRLFNPLNRVHITSSNTNTYTHSHTHKHIPKFHCHFPESVNLFRKHY